MLRNDEFLYQLKSANPIESVVGSYVNLLRQGHNYVCTCPFHSEKTPSCTVFTDTQSFYCFGCGAGGDVITFIMGIENLEFSEAVKLLAERSGIQIPEQNKENGYADKKRKIYEANREAGNYFYLNMIKGSDKRGLNYFIERKLSPQTIKKYGLGYAPDSWDCLYKHMKSKGFSDEILSDAWLCAKSEKNGKYYDLFRNRAMFPIVDLRGNIIGFGGRVLDDSKPKYLNTNKTPVFDKGNNLFSLNFARNSPSKKLILAEGYMDVISLNQAGFENSVATLGTALTSSHATKLKRYCDELLLCYDSDNAGQKASQRAINILSEAGISARIIKMEGAKDPDEYIKKFGADRFRSLMNDSEDANSFMLERCAEGLDINSEQGKIEFIKRAVRFLAGIQNTIERDIYISQTVEKSGISKDILKSHIDSEIKKNTRTEEKREWNNVVAETFRNDEINPESVSHRREANAEEEIIRYLLRYPEKAEIISRKAPPEIFITDFNKKVYSALCNAMTKSEHFTISMLADEFSLAEMGRISGIEAKNKNITAVERGFEECAEVLKSYNNAENLSDESILEKFQKKGKK